MQKILGALTAAVIVTALPTVGFAQTHERSKPERPAAAAHVERAAPARVERAAPVRVERAAPVRVERAAPVRIERAAPVRVERAAPVRVERAAPVRVERAAPVRVERAAPVRVERAAPVRVERAAPVRIERAAPVRIERHAPVRFERAAPVRIERAEPVRIERNAPRYERVAPRTKFVQVIEPRTIARPRFDGDRDDRRSSFVRTYPRTVVYHVPTYVQYVQLPRVVERPAYIYTTYPQAVAYNVLPAQMYGYDPYYNAPVGQTYYEPGYNAQPYYNDPYYASNAGYYNGNCDGGYVDQYGNCQYDNGNPYGNGNYYGNGNPYGQYASYPYNVYGAPFGNSVLQGVVVANQGSSMLVLTSSLHPVIVNTGFANQYGNGNGVGNVAPGTMIEALGFYQGNTFVATALN